MNRCYQVERQTGNQWLTLGIYQDMDYAMSQLKEWFDKLPNERHRLIMVITLHDTERF